MHALLFLLGCVLAASGAPYRALPRHEMVVYSCMNLVSETPVVFCAPSADDGPYAAYYCPCKNQNALATALGCITQLNLNKTSTFEFFAAECKEEGYNLTYPEVVSAQQYFMESSVSVGDASRYNETGVITRPLVLDEDSVDLYMEAYVRFYNNYDGSLYYSLGLMGYWILILVLFAANRWAKYFFPGFFVRSPGYSWANKLRKYVFVPAAFGKRKQEPIRMGGVFSFVGLLMPSRAESLALVGFLFLSIVVMGANISFLPGDPLFLTRKMVIWRYLADRTGIIATICTPMLILFGGRNNFLQWLTGMNYASFIMIHRWIARMLIVMTFIHSICYSLIYGSEYAESMKERYLVFGLLGTAAAGLLFAQSFMVLRRVMYELFLVVHIALAAVFIVGLWIHVDELGFVVFMYVSVAIWGFDRLVRLIRIFWFGFPKANVSLINGDTIRVVVPKPKAWHAAQGGFAYVYLLHGTKFFQSHPFTYLELPGYLHFYLKVKEGVTQSFYKKLTASPNQAMKIRVAVEGPYGGGLESANIKHYHSALFLAGGNGIPGMFSEAYHFGKVDNTQKVKLVWVVRDYNWINVFYEELVEMAKSRAKTVIYITQPHRPVSGFITELGSSDSESNEEKKDMDEKTYAVNEINSQVIARVHANLPHVEFRHGRPVPAEVIDEEIEECEGSLAIAACGHASMVDEVRHAIAERQEGKVRVDFYEHLQVWA